MGSHARDATPQAEAWAPEVPATEDEPPQPRRRGLLAASPQIGISLWVVCDARSVTWRII